MAVLSQAPVIAVFSHVGFQDAADGASHQALAYFSMVSAIPHTQVYALTCAEEAEALMSQTLDRYASEVRNGKDPESVVFFLGRENFPLSYGANEYRLGQAQVVYGANSQSPKLVIAASGALLGQALKAAELLAMRKIAIETVVINPSIINRPDVQTFKTHLAKAGGRLLTVEDHQLIAGMGAQLTHALLQEGVELKSRSLGVKGEFGQSAYNAIDLYKKHGLDSEAIYKAALELSQA
jgi:transketolase